MLLAAEFLADGIGDLGIGLGEGRREELRKERKGRGGAHGRSPWVGMVVQKARELSRAVRRFQGSRDGLGGMTGSLREVEGAQASGRSEIRAPRWCSIISPVARTRSSYRRIFGTAERRQLRQFGPEPCRSPEVRRGSG